MSFHTSDIQRCRNQGHRFQSIGSDKTPMKKSLMCVTCTDLNQMPTFVAYGVDTLSWGQWRTMKLKEEEFE